MHTFEGRLGLVSGNFGDFSGHFWGEVGDTSSNSLAESELWLYQN